MSLAVLEKISQFQFNQTLIHFTSRPLQGFSPPATGCSANHDVIHSAAGVGALVNVAPQITLRDVRLALIEARLAFSFDVMGTLSIWVVFVTSVYGQMCVIRQSFPMLCLPRDITATLCFDCERLAPFDLLQFCRRELPTWQVDVT